MTGRSCGERALRGRWDLVAWVDAADAPKTLDGLAQVAATLGVVGPGGDLPGTGLAVRRWLETSAKKSPEGGATWR